MQTTLFDSEPERDATKSQWFTPPWLARRLARWVSRRERFILEPSCGSGNLIAALLALDPSRSFVAIDVDARFVEHARTRFVGASVETRAGDFLRCPLHELPRFDAVVMNPPFEENAHMHFVARALQLAPVVYGVFPASFEYGKERDEQLWAPLGAVTHRARMPFRVDYGGDQSASFDSLALRITRRQERRRPDEQRPVYEEIWRP